MLYSFCFFLDLWRWWFSEVYLGYGHILSLFVLLLATGDLIVVPDTANLLLLLNPPRNGTLSDLRLDQTPLTL